MKTTLFTTTLTLLALTACQTTPKTTEIINGAFADAQAMVDAMPEVTFCTDTFNIIDFGASQDATDLENRDAINAAIDKASENGGGVVLVPEGMWETAALTLKSNVNLHVSEGATLLFSTVYEHYLPAVLTRWEGLDCYNLQPLIYAYEANNIAITGKGTIDGNASRVTWWFMKGQAKHGWKDGEYSQEKSGRPLLLDADKNETPVEERVMGVEGALRPQLINIYKCKDVVIEDVTLKNSPFWVIHPLMVENLTVRRVTIDSHGPNSDGCDPESCKNVLIEDCYFDTGDDCIAIKSGRNYDGRRWNIPSENIYVRNCRMKNGHGGVVVGSEISGGFRNLWVENCEMSSPELERVIRIKTSECRGGVIENIYVRNLEVGECREAILKINLQYEPNEDCHREFPPVVRNVNLTNITSKKSIYGAYIIGLEKTHNVESVHISDCNFKGVKKGNSIENAEDVTFDNVIMNDKVVEN